jgi:ornithine cyclodeaminase
MLLLSAADVHAMLPMRECIDVMADALAALDDGRVLLPLRTVLRLPGGANAFASMPAFAERLGGEGDALGVKVITVWPGNEATPYDSHQGAVLLFDMEHGGLAAMMDASAITAIRTAAVSGLATRLLAREDARELALIGAGVQAETHLAAMRIVRPIERVRVWSRTPERLLRFVARASVENDVEIVAAESAESAVEGADIVCTVTSSREPVVRGAWLAPGTHVNAVGASLRTARELDSDAIARARLVVDRRESAMAESGDFLVPREEGMIDDEHIVAELGELVAGRAAFRRSDEDITVFKSLGLAVEDLAAARHVLRRATGAGVGTSIVLGGLREADA